MCDNLLSKQVALITGASSGIGRAIALGLAQAGVQVCLVGRHLNKLQAVVRCAESGAKPMATYPADLTQDEAVHALVRQVQAEFGGIDLLVHSAGMIALGRMDQAAITDFDRQYRLNVRMPYLLTQLLLTDLIARQGQIVFINSSVGLAARGGIGQYAATKHALKAIADSVREELNPHGVRVLSVYPGKTATAMQHAVSLAEQKAYHPERLLQAEDIASAVLNALTLRRTAELTELNIRPMLKG